MSLSQCSSLDEYLFFNSLVVTCIQFGFLAVLVFVFKFVVLWVVQRGKVYLLRPPSWLEVPILVFLYAYIILNSKCGIILYITVPDLFHLAIYDNLFLIIKLFCIRKLVKTKITSSHTAQTQPLLIFWYINNPLFFHMPYCEHYFTNPVVPCWKFKFAGFHCCK